MRAAEHGADRDGLADAEEALAADQAASKSTRAARTRAARALEIAVRQLTALGRTTEVDALNTQLQALAEQGAHLPLGPFDLIEPLGRGSMGEVWRARHRAEGIDVAVKVLTAAAARSAAHRDALEVPDDPEPGQWASRLSAEDRRAIEGCFKRLREGGVDAAGVDALAAIIESVRRGRSERHE